MLTLRRVRSQEMTLGSPLTYDLLDCDGTVLVPAGTCLTHRVLRTLPERVYASAKSINRSRVAKVVGDVFARLGHGRMVPCERREPRRVWRTRLQIEIEAPEGSLSPRRVTEVQTHDISRNGCSFLYRQFLPAGSRIYMRIDMLPSRPVLVGEVRNCTLIEGMLHRVGVEFVGASPRCAGLMPGRRTR
jgi:hypothetical protein